MAASTPRVSIVIPTKNAGSRLEQTLAALRSQDLGEPFELLVIDSGSTDGSLTRARAFGARVLSVPPWRFAHGRTRNHAARLAHGEYLVFLVQDAIPGDSLWLAGLVRALDEHPEVAGAYSRHIAHTGASFLGRQAAHYWHLQMNGPSDQRLGDPVCFQRLPLDEKQRRCTFNNVSSIVRRSVWEGIPFREVPFAEDLAWGYDVLRAGHALRYEPTSVVRHSHERSAWYEFRRACVEARTVGELFGQAAQPLGLRELWRLVRIWRVAGVEAATICRGGIEAVKREVLETLERRSWYRQNLTTPALARIFGGLSPYPREEQQDLFYALNRQAMAQGFVSRQGEEQWYWDRMLLEGDPFRRHIWRAAWSDGSVQMAPQELDMVFDTLWDQLGRDYVRRAVLEETANCVDDEWHLLERSIRRMAAELALSAQGEEVLDTQLYRAIWRHSVALTLGRRIGAAMRNGTGGRWGWLLSTLVLRGI